MAAIRKWRNPYPGEVVGAYTATGRHNLPEDGHGVVFEMVCKCGTVRWVMPRYIFGPSSYASMNGCKKCNPMRKTRAVRQRKYEENRKAKSESEEQKERETVELTANFIYGNSLQNVLESHKSLFMLTARNSLKIRSYDASNE